jgi:hypothetical protein
VSTPAAPVWYGSDRGMVLGPYLPEELHSRAFAIAWLTQVMGSGSVYRICAWSEDHAKRCLDRQLSKERNAR